MINRTLRIISIVLAIVASAGCRREEIRVYTVAKDRPAPATVASSPHEGQDMADAHARPRPQVTWKLPAGWKETAPGRMSIASFSIAGANGKEAQVTITPLPMLAGREADIVNMWRENVGLNALSPEEATKELRDVSVGGDTGKLFEITGKGESNQEPSRIITAMAHRTDSSWFYKLAGDQSLVEAQRPAFLEFLKSISIKESEAANETASASTGKYHWQVPGDWKEVPAGQMQAARFAVPEKNGAKADVFVSVFPSDTGGTLANVNRWRRQLKLSEIGEPDLAKVVKPIEGAAGAILTDLSNNETHQQLIGAIVPRGGQYWFYKILGGADAVEPQRENFIRFVQSTP